MSARLLIAGLFLVGFSSAALQPPLLAQGSKGAKPPSKRDQPKKQESTDDDPDVIPAIHSPKISSKKEEREVAFEIRFLTVPESVMEKIGMGYGLKDRPVNTLTQSEVFKLMKMLETDPACNVTQAPRVAVEAGETSEVKIQQQLSYVTGVSVNWDGDKMVCTPKNETLTEGLKFTLTPVIAGDNRAVKVDLKVKMAELELQKVPTTPVQFMVNKRAEEGADAKPKQVAQFIQQPKLLTYGVDRTLMIADGRTALMKGWKKHEVAPAEPANSGFLPSIGKLFKSDKPPELDKHVLLLVTPKIMAHEEPEIKQTSGRRHR